MTLKQRLAEDELYEALQLALPKLAHTAECSFVRPTHEWAEHGSLSFDNCCCEIKQVSSALQHYEQEQSK